MVFGWQKLLILIHHQTLNLRYNKEKSHRCTKLRLFCLIALNRKYTRLFPDYLKRADVFFYGILYFSIPHGERICIAIAGDAYL